MRISSTNGFRPCQPALTLTLSRMRERGQAERERGESARNEPRIAEPVLAVAEGGAVERRHAAAGGEENGVAGGGVPFHRRAEARVEVGFAGGGQDELDRAAATWPLGGGPLYQGDGEA